MQDGYATAIGLMGEVLPPDSPRLVFVVPGETTSENLIKAFKQGLQGDPANAAYSLRGYRCPRCGSVELIALDKVAWKP